MIFKSIRVFFFFQTKFHLTFILFVIVEKNEADVQNGFSTLNFMKEGIKFLNNVQNCILFEFGHVEDLPHLFIVNPGSLTISKTNRNDVSLFPFESLLLAATTEIVNDPNMEDGNWKLALLRYLETYFPTNMMKYREGEYPTQPPKFGRSCP